MVVVGASLVVGVEVADQLFVWGKGQRPDGWSMDLQPLQFIGSRATPAPYRAVRKVSAETTCLHSRS